MIIKNIIILSILSVLLISCEVKDNKEMIDLAKINVVKYQQQLNKIIQWIDKNESVCIKMIEVTHPQNIVKIYCDTSFIVLEDKPFSDFLIQFYKDFGIYRIQKFENGIAFTSNIRNKSLDSYSYVYYRIPINNPYYDYKVYDKEIPKHVSGWMYKLKENWYLESLPEYPDTNYRLIDTLNLDSIAR